MSSLVEYAKRELDILLCGGDDWQGSMRANILEIVELVERQGHSDMQYYRLVLGRLLGQLLRQGPLTPLMGGDDEWVDHSEFFLRNRRDSHVYKEKATGRAYVVDGYIFKFRDGSGWFTNAYSERDIEFPYISGASVRMVSLLTEDQVDRVMEAVRVSGSVGYGDMKLVYRALFREVGEEDANGEV